MICTLRGEHPVHCTTMLILEQLKHYSWDAKVLIVQAAFALEYGKFLYLLPLIAPCQQFENSFADLHGLLTVAQNKKHLIHFNTLVKKVMEVVECITKWKKLTSAGYDIRDVPTLTETLQEIPVFVYWTIFTFVTCTGQIDDLTDNKDQRNELSTQLENKLDPGKFKELLKNCSSEIERIEDFTRRKNVMTRGRDIVKVLKALLIAGDNRDLRQNVYHIGLTGEQQVKLEEFKKKYLLLFISGLENMKEEIQLLNSINEKMKEKPREVEDYRSVDFKILWIPIVNEWNEERKKKLESNLRDTKCGWYVVKYLNFETSLKLMKEVFKYEEKHVILLINPQGMVENFDTMQIMSEWGIEGFPFRTSDQTRLSQQWKWFWSEITKFNPTIENLMEEEDCYLFIYGGTDTKWIQEFRAAMEALKNDVENTNFDTNITIQSYQLGKEDNKVVLPRFWIAIDNLLTSRRQVKGGERGKDFATNEIKRLLFLKQDPKGWVILSKGKNVRLLGHGEAMCRTVKEFETWRDKLREVSFDVAFKEHYNGIKDKEGSRKCEESVICYDYPTDIVERIACPKKDCRLPMAVTSVNYKCCHRHGQ